jgi:hypothetical protein
MTKRNNYVGPCATACKPGAGTDTPNGTFDRILVAATEHADREAGLPGRVDRTMIYCRVCRAETSNDRLCDTCIEAGIEIRACERCKQTFTAFGSTDALCLQCLEEDARREERAAALEERCRVHRVRYVEDLPVSVLQEMHAEWGRC